LICVEFEDVAKQDEKEDKQKQKDNDGQTRECQRFA